MKPMILSRYFFAVIFVLAVALPQSFARAETFVGSTVDSRILIGFNVSSAGLQPMLPEGWVPIPYPRGPLAGANLLVSLIDRALDLDPDGKPKTPPNSRATTLLGLAKQDGGDEVRLFIYRVYTTAPGYDPYGNSMNAEVSRTASTGGAANEGRSRSEVWNIAPENGGELDVSVAFTSGARGWTSSEANPHSNINPDFSRIYRSDRLVDLAMSAPMGKPLAGEFGFSSTVPELADIFDGTEEAIAILDMPVYVLKTYLP